jgi:nitrate reductase / nitrite oxidoreductase, beta subunit
VAEPTTRTTTATTGTDGPAADALLRTGRFFTRREISDDLRTVYRHGGREGDVSAVLKLAAMRSYRRDIALHRPRNESIAESVGMTGGEILEMYRLLAIAKYEERYVIPTAYEADAHSLEEIGCSLDVDGGPGMLVGSGPFGEASGRPTPVSVETFHALRDRQTSDDFADPGDRGARINLLNWDGKGRPPGLFPPRQEVPPEPGDITGHSRPEPAPTLEEKR